MDCQSMQELIQLYLDSELDARSTLDAQKHLAGCRRCTRTLESFAEQDRLLRQSARKESVPSERVRENILSAIRFQPEPLIWRTIRFKGWRRFAALATVIALGAFLWLRGGLSPSNDQNVYAAISIDHVACSVDSHLGEGMKAEELNRLAAAYGNLSALPDLSSFGYSNARGRICRVKDLDFLHLVFYNEAHKPLSVFLRPRAAGLIPDELSIVGSGRRGIASLTSRDVNVIVVTSADDVRAASVAEAVAKQIEGS